MMFNKPGKKLNVGEMQRVADKIRKKYDMYIVRYMKSPRLKAAFEERYAKAIRGNTDIPNFLAAEISAIEELIKREEERLRNPVEEGAKEAAERKGFADKIIEENSEKIKQYKDIIFHADANEEVRRLLGALNQLYVKFMPDIEEVVKKLIPSLNTANLMDMEGRLRVMASLDKEKISSRLTRYFALLSRFPRDYRAIEQEEKGYILEAAHLLHDFLSILTRKPEREQVAEAEIMEKHASIISFIEGIIDNFRLKELKRRNY